MVDAVGSPSWQLGQNAMFFWLVLGLGVSAMRPLPKANKEDVAAPAQPKRALRFAAAAASLGLAALLPTASLAGGDGYPDHITISPKAATIVGGQSQAYTVKLFYTDNSSVDVTTSPKTTYAENGLGAMAGTNKSVYQSRLRKAETVGVTASYADGSFSDTDDATLTVKER
jgi:hypothetical protein